MWLFWVDMLHFSTQCTMLWFAGVHPYVWIGFGKEKHMNKKLVALAVSAALAAPLAAQADVTLFGTGRLSINFDDNAPIDNGQSNTYMASNQSAFGIKGSEDLGNGLKAIFHFEWEIDPTETRFPGQTNTLSDRDQWVGLASNFGQMVFGSISTSYKMSGAAIDPFYRTSLQLREFPGIESELQRGSGKYGGRETNTVSYASPDFMGLKLVAQAGLDETANNNASYGGGLHYQNGPFLAFYDYINGNLPQVDNQIGLPQSVKQLAQKAGGKFTFGPWALFGQYEWDNGLITQARFADRYLARFPGLGSAAVPVVTGNDGNTWFVGGSAKFGNTLLVVEYGQALESAGHVMSTGQDFILPKSNGWVVGARHWLSKRTDVYIGYTQYDPSGFDTEHRATIGINHNF
jgi:predicted porin